MALNGRSRAEMALLVSREAGMSTGREGLDFLGGTEAKWIAHPGNTENRRNRGSRRCPFHVEG